MVGADLMRKVVHPSNLPFLLLVSVFFLPEYSRSDSLSCNDYQIQELRDLCTDDDPDVHVYDDVSETGLNQLADSWDESDIYPQLRVIPPGRYVLSKPLVLPPTNRILPHPTLPVPEGALRTIELVAGDDFQQAADGFYLLRIEQDTQAGAIEVHGDHQPPELMASLQGRNITSPRNCLVRVTSVTETGFIAAVLTGHKTLDGLFCDTATNEFSYYRGFNGLSFKRNYLHTRGARGGLILAAAFDGNLLQVKNNSFFIDPVSGAQEGDISSGLYLGRLKPYSYSSSRPYLIRHNDFVFPHRPEDSASIRRGIEIGNATAFQLELNAFITPGADKVNEKDIAIFDSQAKVSGWRIMDLSGNTFSPYLVALSAHQGKGGEVMDVLADGSKEYSYSSPYPLASPEAFMTYQGNLGNTPVLVSRLQSGLSHQPVQMISRDDLPDSFTDKTDYLASAATRCPYCSELYTPEGYRIFLSVIFPVIAIATSGGCGCFIRYRTMGKARCSCR